jgi:hypothetical protein
VTVLVGPADLAVQQAPGEAAGSPHPVVLVGGNNHIVRQHPGHERRQEDLVAVVQLIDREGAVVAEQETPVGGVETRTSIMRPNDVAIGAHRIILPNAIAEYSVVAGIRRPNGEWLAITSTPERLDKEALRFPGRVVVDNVDAR